mmetsp:Transcript_24164/g.24094  ORF Transcript_24164/g.24094 Transcript_24164/m.24094 type:complete len:96 (-) Transcript_24164:54-341(-)
MDTIKNKHNQNDGFSQHGYSTGFGGSFGESPHVNAHMASTSHLRPLLGAEENGFETTNQRNFKDYQIHHRPQTCKPKADVVRTGNNPKHFKTSNM